MRSVPTSISSAASHSGPGSRPTAAPIGVIGLWLKAACEEPVEGVEQPTVRTPAASAAWSGPSIRQSTRTTSVGQPVNTSLTSRPASPSVNTSNTESGSR